VRTQLIGVFSAVLLASFSQWSHAEAVFEFRGVIDSSIATYPPAVTAYATDGDPVVYRVVLPGSYSTNEPLPSLLTYQTYTTIQIGDRTYTSPRSFYMGFFNYVNPAIGTYNGFCQQDEYSSSELLYGQFALYNLVGATTTDSAGVLLPSCLIPAPGADATAGYNIGMLHFSDSQTPQAHTFWRVTEYSVTFVPPPDPVPDPEPTPDPGPAPDPPSDPGDDSNTNGVPVEMMAHLDRNQSQILALAMKQQHLTIKECAQQLHISSSTARRDLQKLAGKGILVRRGKGSRLAYWLSASQ
jgi:hypothetical protein